MSKFIGFVVVGLLTLGGCGLFRPADPKSQITGGSSSTEVTHSEKPVFAPVPAPSTQSVVTLRWGAPLTDTDGRIFGFVPTERTETKYFSPPLPPAAALEVFDRRTVSSTQPSASGDTASLKGGSLDSNGFVGGFSGNASELFAEKSFKGVWIGIFAVAAIGAAAYAVFIKSPQAGGLAAGLVVFGAVGLLPSNLIAWGILIVILAGLGIFLYVAHRKGLFKLATEELSTAVHHTGGAGSDAVRSKLSDTTEKLAPVATLKP